MIWLTWRQFRAQAMAAAALLALVAIALLATGPHLAALFNSSGVAGCIAKGDCGTAVNNFGNTVKATTLDELIFFIGLGILLLFPVLIGAFWGAPLVAREYETGTFRLAWNQSMTRSRWLAIKIGLLGLAAMAVTALLTFMISWWSSPVYTAGALAGRNNGVFNRFAPVLFDATGVAPIGYAAFAFAIGVTAGLLIRRTLPAVAVTLAVFAAVQIAWPRWIRPHLFRPATASLPLNTANINTLMTSPSGQVFVSGSVNKPGAWVLTNTTVTAAGQPFTGPATHACASSRASAQACMNSIGRLHLRQLISYQPASRFWEFQWTEAAVYLGLAVALAAVCLLLIRRRRFG